ncbi:MAG: alkaline phosphatase D family protein [Erythrobacter sp.]|nr:alkaline phosphatase D family protein [Erythrobacter sp.]
MFPTEPPAAALLPALDRRHVLKGGILAAGALSAPLSAQLTAQRGFTHGVASGEPGADGVLLWTRFVAGQDTALDWQMMEADANRRVVAEGRVIASPDRDFCCKAQVSGLEPGRWYYYRFTAPDGTQSDEGRTRTLPVGPTARFRMAVFSCSNMGFGWFNAYAHAAESNQFDCALHLGDYFYEYGPGTYDNPDFAMRQPDPAREIVALADYRARYAQYRSDRDLQRLHQVYPMIAGWDDHESANDSWKGGAQNHQPETEGPWSARKAAAMRAYREWMPVSDEPWAAYEIGDLATLFRLETRLEARSEQFDYASILSGKATPESASAALVAFRDGVYADPAREMLGARQQAWLADGLMRSARAGKPWQVLVQQVLMGKLATAPRLAENLPSDMAERTRRYVEAGAMASRNELPLNLDAWDGYPAARERVLRAALEADANLVSLAGDTHNAWAFDLAQDGARVGVEFGGQSVTSPGLENYVTYVPTAELERETVAFNPELRWMDASHRGYMAVELTPGSATSEYRLMGARQRGAALAGTKRITALAGQKRLETV